MRRRLIMHPPEAFKAVRTRKRGLEATRPTRRTWELLNQVRAILAEYSAYLPMTIRQIFYRLVGAYGYGKTESAYRRLIHHVSNARRSGIIPWEAIRDDGLTDLSSPWHYDALHMVEDFVKQAKDFRMDRQRGQDTRLIFWVEAAGMAPMVERYADPYGIRVLSSGGFDSVTVKHDMALQLLDYGEPVEVLHIGDHDPSGVHLYSSLYDDVTKLAQDIALQYDHALDPELITFTRLAVTQEQMRDLQLETAPPKKEDQRAFAGLTTQVEAIPPDIFVEIIEESVNERMYIEIYEQVLAEERVIRTQLVNALRPVQRHFAPGRNIRRPIWLHLSPRPITHRED
jgi:hypothetical protein